jgi:hypothetical protein
MRTRSGNDTHVNAGKMGRKGKITKIKLPPIIESISEERSSPEVTPFLTSEDSGLLCHSKVNEEGLGELEGTKRYPGYPVSDSKCSTENSIHTESKNQHQIRNIKNQNFNFKKCCANLFKELDNFIYASVGTLLWYIYAK